MALVLVVMLALFSSHAALAQTQITNTASISAPPTVTNTNAAPGCSAGTCTVADLDAVVASLPQVSKTFTPSSISAGGTSLLVITFTNTHKLATATFNSLFTDVYPAGLVNAPTPSPASTCLSPVLAANAGQGTLTVAIGTGIAPNSSCTVSVIVTSAVSPQVVNTIPAGSLSTNVGASSNTTTAALTVSPVADLSVFKTASVATLVPGATFTYTIVLSNAGPSTATGASFADSLPIGLGALSSVSSQVSVGASTANFVATATSLNGSATIPPLGSVTITFQVTVASGVSGSFANVAFVTAPPGTTDPVSSNNSFTATVVVLLTDISTTIALPTSAVAGTTVTGTVTYSNATSVATTFTSSITINGVLATQTTFVGANTSTAVPISVFVGTVGATVTAVASGSTVPETTLANNSATARIAAIATDVSVTIAVPTSASPGQTISATVTFTNSSSVPAQGVSGLVTLPNGVTVSIAVGSLNAGSSTVSVVSYTVPSAQTATMTWSAAVTTTIADTNLANNLSVGTTTVIKVFNASLSGRVWLDTNSDKAYTNGVDQDLSGWKVELLQGTTVVGTATTGADGRYTISGQTPGGGYSVRFKNPAGQVIVSTPFNQGPVAVAGRTTQNGNPSVGTTTSIVTGTNIIGGLIDSVILYAGDNTIEQNLPIDPSGVVYDSVTRKPVAGAVVTLLGPDGNAVSGANLLQGSSTLTTDASGVYQFDLLPAAPSGRYRLQITPPQGYTNTPASQGGVSQPGVAPGTTQGSVVGGAFQPPTNVALIAVQPNATAPAVGVNGAGAVGGVGTQYFLDFDIKVGANQSAGVIHNHVPLDPIASGAILVSKVGDKSVAEIADSVRYTIRIRNTTPAAIANVNVEDLLPAGFRYIPATSRLNSATLADPAGGVGRALTFSIGTVAGNSTVELSYYVRIGVGAQQGDGINRATAVFTGASGAVIRSNTAQYKVTVQGGVFSNDGCIVGKVYVDCDGNHVQNNESGSRELGIPGVRLVMLDGSYVITDNEGKYSMCGVKPQTHVIKVDRSTLPKGSRLQPSSNRNAGVGDSLFVDLKAGELARADFIEGSCSPEVLDQVKARRAQGGVLAPEKELSQDVKIDNRPSDVPQQILPSLLPAAPASSGAVAPGGARP